jgi:four helix bundle protein
MTFDEWLSQADPRLAFDRIWRMRAYQLAHYLTAMAWVDVEVVAANPVTRESAAQLIRAIGAVRADLVEGYSRSSGRDRARCFEYALGSVREVREWYMTVTPVLGEAVVSSRCEYIGEIIRLLLTAIPQERKRKIEPDDLEDDEGKRRR